MKPEEINGNDVGGAEEAKQLEMSVGDNPSAIPPHMPALGERSPAEGQAKAENNPTTDPQPRPGQAGAVAPDTSQHAITATALTQLQEKQHLSAPPAAPENTQPQAAATPMYQQMPPGYPLGGAPAAAPYSYGWQMGGGQAQMLPGMMPQPNVQFGN